MKHILYTASKNEEPLYVNLPANEADVLSGYIVNMQELPSVSLKKLIADLQENGPSSSYFKPLRDYLAHVEGVCKVTYNDKSGGCSLPGTLLPVTGAIENEGKMTIGIGLNVEGIGNNVRLQALFIELDGTRAWPFQDMGTIPGVPNDPDHGNPPLTDDQINQLLVLTLIGAGSGDRKYNGILNDVGSHLGEFLSDTDFPFHQLVGFSGTWL